MNLSFLVAREISRELFRRYKTWDELSPEEDEQAREDTERLCRTPPSWYSLRIPASSEDTEEHIRKSMENPNDGSFTYYLSILKEQTS